jgi:hypothetical protein
MHAHAWACSTRASHMHEHYYVASQPYSSVKGHIFVDQSNVLRPAQVTGTDATGRPTFDNVRGRMLQMYPHSRVARGTM